MLGDDFGHNNIGWRNAEIKSPAMDELAAGGVKLDRHYTYKYCSPTRSSFLSGRLPYHVNQNNLCNDEASTSGIDLRMTLLPEKLRRAGYQTHMAGKWHGGARTAANLPINRGFDTHIGFLKGGEDHFTQRSGPAVDLWQGRGPAFGRNGTFSTFIYAGRAVELIEAHDPAVPFFLYLPFHVTHTPLEVPPQYEYNSSVYNNTNRDRSTFNAMVRVMDEGVANVTDALKARGMWDDTLLVWASDNGGWVGNSGSSNWPLRGSKVSDFEGGVRTVAFMAGGALPAAARGTTAGAYVHVTDFHATFCALAGVPAADDVPGLPAVDAVDVWDALTAPAAGTAAGTAPLARTEMVLAGCNPADDSDCTGGQATDDSALLVLDDELLPFNGSAGAWKLVNGRQQGRGTWQGPVYPNGTKDPLDDSSCVAGCLFDVAADPTEHADLAALPAYGGLLARMRARLAARLATGYQTAYAEPNTTCIPDTEAHRYYNGFLGPPCFKGTPPAMPTPPPSPAPKMSAFSQGGRCLAAAEHAHSLQKTAPALVSCASPAQLAQWSTEGTDAGTLLVNVGAAPGTPFFLKLNETGGGSQSQLCARGSVYLNNDAGQGARAQGFAVASNGGSTPQTRVLESTFCEGLCLAASATGVSLEDCASETAVQWTVTTTQSQMSAP